MELPNLQRFFKITNPAGWVGERSRLGSHLLIYVESGEMTVECPMGHLTIQKGQVLCLPRGDLRQAQCQQKTRSLRMRWLGKAPHRGLFDLDSSSNSILSSLLLFQQEQKSDHNAMPLLVLALLESLQSPKDKKWQTPRHRKGTHNFQPWIDKALVGKSNIAEGAVQMGMHRDHFTRLFKSRYGSSPKKWLMETRFNLAQQWIEEDGLGATEIVRAFGMEDVSLFCLQFRKRFGCSPGQWKEKSSVDPN